MPNITTYIDNKTYVDFLQLDDEEKKQLRDEFSKDIKDYIKHKKINKKGNPYANNN